MRIAPGLRSLPARSTSINARVMKPGALEAIGAQGFSEEHSFERRTINPFNLFPPFTLHHSAPLSSYFTRSEIKRTVAEDFGASLPSTMFVEMRVSRSPENS